jgi:hypothetical protein
VDEWLNCEQKQFRSCDGPKPDLSTGYRKQKPKWKIAGDCDMKIGTGIMLNLIDSTEMMPFFLIGLLWHVEVAFPFSATDALLSREFSNSSMLDRH